ncbi:methyltransferase, FxLD system [Longispora urticae]
MYPEPATAWRQVNLRFADWRAAERHAACDLGPVLMEAEETGLIMTWWFIRKGDTWRLRILPGDDPTRLNALLARIACHENVLGHSMPIYEPEVHAFGGPEGMSITHNLAHADSRHILRHLAVGGDDRRELGLLLASRMMTAAGLDWYERGAVWHNVAVHRANPDASPPPPTPGLISAVRRLITALADAPGSPLRTTPDWPAAYERAGQWTGYLAHHGELTRGLRAVLTHHVLFAFNRLGIAADHQHLLASAASTVAFHTDHDTGPDTREGRPTDSRVTMVTADHTDTKPSDAAVLRNALADTIKGRGTFRTAAVEEAFRTVPREEFLPGVDLEIVYGPRQVVIKSDPATGSADSSLSDPNLVAGMDEDLEIQPGDNVLEVGTATGFQAAVAQALTGPTGRVITIEYDAELADGARTNLASAGYPQVTVVTGDGALGHAEAAPYQRMIITAGAWDISEAWWDQLAAGGRIVVPLRLHGSGLTRSLAFDRTGPDQLVSTSARVCGFVPMRGSGRHDDDHIRLDTDVVLKVDADDQPDRAALSRVLQHPRRETWTGLTVHDNDPIGHLDLWLFHHTQKPFARLGVGKAAKDSGLVTPAYRWAGAGLYDAGTVAYLAFRPAGDGNQDLGVISHGPDAHKLGAELTDLLHSWTELGRPNEPTITARRTGTGPTPPGAITRPCTTLTIEI